MPDRAAPARGSDRRRLARRGLSRVEGRQALGARCEAIAANFLEAKGYRILQRNHRCRLGEVDLICEDGETVVFVEVKARRSMRFGDGAESVGPRKQARLMAIAELYLARQGGSACRFDVVLVQLSNGIPRLDHLIGAFP